MKLTTVALPPLTPDGARVVFATLLCVLIGAVYFDYLTYGRLFLFTDIGSDTVNAHYPRLVHIADYLRREGVPMWSFRQGMGQNVFPDSLGDPFRWPLYLVGRDLIPYAIIWVEVLKVALGGWVFFLYLRLIGLTPLATVGGGLTYAFCGYAVLGGTWYTFTLETLYLALLLYAFERYLLRGGWRLLPVAFALIAAGRPFALYMMGLALLIYGTYRYATVRGWAPRAYLGFMARLGGMAALGVGVGAFQFLPEAMEMLHSPRVAGAGSAFARLAAADPFQTASASELGTALLRLFSNDLLGSGSDFRGWGNYLNAPLFYCGLAALLLAPQALPHLTRRRRGVVLAMAAGFALAVAFPYLRHAFWLFSGDYYRFFSFAAALFLILCAVHALDRIQATGRVQPALLAATTAGLLAILFFPYDPPVQPGLRAACGLLIAAYCALIWMLGRARSARPAAVALVVLVAVELGGFAHVTVNRRVAMTPAQLHQRTGYNDRSLDAVRLLETRDPGWYRISKTFHSGPAIHDSLNDALIQGFRGTASYHRFNQPAYTAFLVALEALPSAYYTEKAARWLPGLPHRPLLETLLGVKYRLSREGPLVPPASLVYRPLAHLDGVRVYANRLFLPLGFTYDRYLPRARFDALPPQEKDVALLAAFVPGPGEEAATAGIPALDKPLRPAEVPALVAARRREVLDITAQGENRILGTVNLAAPRLLFLSIPFDPGWSARVDGRPARLLRVNIGFTGLPLTAGAHTVALRYRPPYMLSGSTISVLSLLLYGAGAVRRWGPRSPRGRVLDRMPNL